MTLLTICLLSEDFDSGYSEGFFIKAQLHNLTSSLISLFCSTNEKITKHVCIL